MSLPGLLRESAGGEARVAVPGSTLEEALTNLWARHPSLRVHLFDDHGRQRPHVLLFYNGENFTSLDTLDVPLRGGDRLDVLQAVSGG